MSDDEQSSASATSTYNHRHAPASPHDIDSIVAEFEHDMRATRRPRGSPQQWWKPPGGAPSYASPSRLARRLHEVADKLEEAVLHPKKHIATTTLESFPSLAEEASKDPEDPNRVYWDMTFVFPVPNDEEKRVLETPRKKRWGFRKQERFDHEVFVKKAQHAGLVTSSYLSTQRDEVYVRVGATHQRLRLQADNIDFPMPLHEARLRTLARKGIPDKSIAPMDIPERTPPADGAVAFSRFRAFESVYGKFDTKAELDALYLRTHEHAYHGGDSEHSLFNSMRRLKLLWSCLNDDAGTGGAGMPVEKHVAKRKILAALAMHDRAERKYLYEAWVGAPWSTPPRRMPLEAYKEYFGEKQGLLMAFKAHVTQGYGAMAVFGLAIMLWWLALRIRTDEYHITADGSIVLYAGVVALWSICNTEYWRRTERTYALEWGMVGFEATEQRRPQFKGLKDMCDPVSGRPGAFFPPHRRSKRICCGVLVTAFCVLVNMFFLLVCVWIKTDEGLDLYFGLQGKGYMLFGSVLNAAGILLFKEGYEIIAVQLTDAENWMTDTVYADKLIAKLTAFNFINSYFSLFYVIFFMPHGEQPKESTFHKLQESLIIILASVIGATNLTGFVLPYLYLYKNMAREGGMTSSGEQRALSVPENAYAMYECDEQLDHIKAFTQEATQYGYITLFSAAFPGAPLMACVNNLFQMRTDGYKYLRTYRRIQPSGVEDIGTYQAIFELMNYAGVVSSFLSIVYRTTVVPNHWPSVWGAKPSKHQLDCVFMVACVFFGGVVAVLRLLIDDVPFDVELQIERNDFLNSKIIDHVADEADAVVMARATQYAAVVHEKDTMEPYATYGELFGNHEATWGDYDTAAADGGASDADGRLYAPDEVVHPA